MTLDLTNLTLPAGIHATLLRERHVNNGSLMERGIVWADRTSRSCETCKEPVPYVVPNCPVTLDQVGIVREYSQRHCDIGGGCGTWISVQWTECEPSEAAITEAAADLAVARRDALEAARAAMRQSLARDLRDALVALADTDDDEAPGDRESRVTTGSDIQPGVYLDRCTSGEWIAWDYDPEDDSETVTVYASNGGA